MRSYMKLLFRVVRVMRITSDPATVKSEVGLSRMMSSMERNAKFCVTVCFVTGNTGGILALSPKALAVNLPGLPWIWGSPWVWV